MADEELGWDYPPGTIEADVNDQSADRDDEEEAEDERQGDD